MANQPLGFMPTSVMKHNFKQTRTVSSCLYVCCVYCVCCVCVLVRVRACTCMRMCVHVFLLCVCLCVCVQVMQD